MHNSEYRHPRRPPHFTERSEFEAWIAATASGIGTEATSACAIHVVDIRTGEKHVACFPSSGEDTTFYRGYIAALRGVVEAVAPRSSVRAFTNSEPLKKAFDNPSGRKEQPDLWERLDTVLEETGVILEVHLAKEGNILKELKKRLSAFRKSV